MTNGLYRGLNDNQYFKDENLNLVESEFKFFILEVSLGPNHNSHKTIYNIDYRNHLDFILWTLSIMMDTTDQII